MLQVAGELVDPEFLEGLQFFDVLLSSAENAKAVDDFVWYEVGMGVTGQAVLVVVVALARCDVVGERLRH